jgi:hypothetical protein
MNVLLVTTILLTAGSLLIPGCASAPIPPIDLGPITDAALITGICAVICSFLWSWAISGKGGRDDK